MISQEKLQESIHFNSLDHIQKQMILKKDNREKISLGLIMSELRGFDFWLEKCQPSDRLKTIVQELILSDVSESVTCFNCNGWGYTLLPNGRRDKHCTVCDGSNVR
jgi:hypothetical protein